MDRLLTLQARIVPWGDTTALHCRSPKAYRMGSASRGVSSVETLYGVRGLTPPFFPPLIPCTSIACTIVSWSRSLRVACRWQWPQFNSRISATADPRAAIPAARSRLVFYPRPIWARGYGGRVWCATPCIFSVEEIISTKVRTVRGALACRRG
jgi:hypothetical protein